MFSSCQAFFNDFRLKYGIQYWSILQHTVDQCYTVYLRLENQFAVGQAVDILVEHILDPILLEGELTQETVTTL
jgi:hypothetical protein